MRAWQTTKSGRPADALRLNENARPPEPMPGTVHLEVIAAGIGLPDAFMCQGSYALTPPTHPFTQGQEVVGRVVGRPDRRAALDAGLYIPSEEVGMRERCSAAFRLRLHPQKWRGSVFVHQR